MNPSFLFLNNIIQSRLDSSKSDNSNSWFIYLTKITFLLISVLISLLWGLFLQVQIPWSANIFALRVIRTCKSSFDCTWMWNMFMSWTSLKYCKQLRDWNIRHCKNSGWPRMAFTKRLKSCSNSKFKEVTALKFWMQVKREKFHLQSNLQCSCNIKATFQVEIFEFEQDLISSCFEKARPGYPLEDCNVKKCNCSNFCKQLRSWSDAE